MLEDAFITIECPQCNCPIGVPLRRVMLGAGAFCPACQTHITFVDDRAGTLAAGRSLDRFTENLSKTITIEFKL